MTTNETLQVSSSLPLWRLDRQGDHFDTLTLREYHMAETNDDYEDEGYYRVSCAGLAIEAADRIEAAAAVSDAYGALAVLSGYFLAQQRNGFPIEETRCYTGTEYKSAEANALVIEVAGKALMGDEVEDAKDSSDYLEVLIEAAKEAEDYYLVGTLLALDVIRKKDELLASIDEQPGELEYGLGTIDLLTMDSLFAFYQAKCFEAVRNQFSGTDIERDINERMQEVGSYLVDRSYKLKPNQHLFDTFFQTISD